MKVTKFGHCCMLIEDGGVRVLTDPGSFSTGQTSARDVNVILITHEHADHLHVESLKEFLKNNPGAKVRTNSSVGKILESNGVNFKLLTDGQKEIFGALTIEAFGKFHAVIHNSIPVIENTGYFIGNRLFYPGDSFTVPPKSVEILALPVEAPWMKLSEAIDYAEKVKPKICFPVHDGRLRDMRVGSTHKIPKDYLAANGVEFVVLEESKEHSFDV